MIIPAGSTLWVVDHNGIREFRLSNAYATTKAEALRGYAELLDREAAKTAAALVAAKDAAAKAHAAAWAATVPPPG